MSDLISRTIRGLFRDLMTSSTLGEIGAAFQDELFAPNPDSTYEDTSSRRTLTQEYLEAVDWTDIDHVNRLLRVFERLVQGFERQYSSKFLIYRTYACDGIGAWRNEMSRSRPAR